MGSLPSPPTSTFPYQTTFLQEVIQALPLSTFLKQQIQIQNLLHLLYQIIQAFMVIYDSSDNNFNSTISSASSSSTSSLSLPSPPTSTFPYQTTFLQEVIQALP